jgi:hypothetical protein
VSSRKVLPRNVLNTLRGARDSFAVLSAFRQSVDSIKVNQLADWLPRAAKSEPVLLDRAFPRRLTSFGTGRLLLPVSLEREVHWCAYLLIQHSEAINHFIDMRSRFNEAIICSDFDLCGEILDTVDGMYGYSLWSIEQRIVLLALSQGLEAQKAYSASIHETAPVLSPHFVHITSVVVPNLR